jgi:MFS transporter, DHA2 family, multidrug resistance protein
MNAQTAGRREWLGLAVIALPCLLYAMDLTVLFLAVPALTEDLNPSASELLWITDVYGFLIAGFLITMGTLGDRIGRRKLLLIGAAAFGAASVLAAFSTSPEMLIASRALLGVAGATLAPSTLSLIRNMFHDPRQRTVAIGVWATSFSVGGAIGPVVGGVMLEQFWWGSVFLLAVPVMALLLAVGPRLLPEFRDPSPGRFDLPSAALSLAAMLSAVYGVKLVAEHGLDGEAATWIGGGVALGALFLRRQRRLADPLVDLSLFRVPAFSTSLAANTFAIFVEGGVFLFTAQYLQLVLGMGALEAGLWLLPSSAGFIAGSMLAPAAAQRARPATVVVAGLSLAAAGLLVITQADAGSGPAVLAFGSIVMALGVAPAVTLGTDLIVGAAPPERAGSAAAISETGAELGGALGVAVLGSIGTAVYRSQVADSVPDGAAADTLGGALEAGLSPDALGAAVDAFVSGMHVAAGLAAALAAATAVAVAIGLRERREAAPTGAGCSDPVAA